MNEAVVLRFAGEAEDSYYLKLGPMDNPNPPEREFRGGDEITVQVRPTPGKPDSIDLMFDDGQFAIEVPREFLVVVE